ncbi:MAG: hypothetical protein GW876_12535, partial [Bacteroidetes bacterium]|nr:hypothetical protein [Bacteroidota bacterium]
MFIEEMTIKQKISSEVNQKTYGFDEVFQSALEYFRGDELAAKVWANKYAMKDSYGKFYEKN